MTGYLDELFSKHDSLKLVLTQGVFIPGRVATAQWLIDEIEKEITKIEQQDVPIFQLIPLQDNNTKWVGFERDIK